MSDFAIRAENLSKQCRIGAGLYRHDTMPDTLASAFTVHLRRVWGKSKSPIPIWTASGP